MTKDKSLLLSSSIIVFQRRFPAQFLCHSMSYCEPQCQFLGCYFEGGREGMSSVIHALAEIIFSSDFWIKYDIGQK